MELLSNLVWITVVLALWGAWLAERRGRGTSLRSGLRVQLTALAVLTVVLLPVISVSDDLQASHNPAEAERTCVRNDQHLLQHEALPPASAAVAVIVSYLFVASPRAIAFLNPPSVPRIERQAHVHLVASRPPPAA